jgi:hypothetical protein
MKIHHCPYCGEEMGDSRDFNRDDYCGSLKCQREWRSDEAERREEAHRDLDERMG